MPNLDNKTNEHPSEVLVKPATSIFFDPKGIAFGLAIPILSSYVQDFFETEIENGFITLTHFVTNQLATYLHPILGQAFLFSAMPGALALADSTYSNLHTFIEKIEKIEEKKLHANPNAIAMVNWWQGEDWLTALAKLKKAESESSIEKLAEMTRMYTGNFFSSVIDYAVQSTKPLAMGATGYVLNYFFPEATFLKYLTNMVITSVADNIATNKALDKKLSYEFILQCYKLLGHSASKIVEQYLEPIPTQFDQEKKTNPVLPSTREKIGLFFNVASSPVPYTHSSLPNSSLCLAA